MKPVITKAHILSFQILNSEAGEKIIEYLEENYFCNDTTFTGDVNQTIFNEGQRSLVNIIKYLKDNYLEIIKQPEMGELKDE
jgi:bifunctional pyridoxal-dependent enzyme with beta-cystathionase and maltose regulon repressor activities